MLQDLATIFSAWLWHRFWCSRFPVKESLSLIENLLLFIDNIS